MNEILNSAIFQLASVGIKKPKVWKGGKHYRISWEHLGEYRTLTVPLSPGDFRSARNNAAQLRRILREDGLIKEKVVVRGPVVQPTADNHIYMMDAVDKTVTNHVPIMPPEFVKRIEAVEANMQAMFDLLLEMQDKLKVPDPIPIKIKAAKPQLWAQKQAKRRLKKIFAA